MNFVINFFTTNFIQILSIIALFVLVLTNTSFEIRTRRLIFTLGILIMLLCYFEYIDTTICNTPFVSADYIKLRIVSACFCYCVRPIILLLALVVLNEPNVKTTSLYAIPAFINTILALLSYWFNLLFYIDASNIWHEGPLRIIYFGVCILYLLLMVISFFANRKHISFNEQIATVFLLIAIISSSIIDTVINNSHTLVLATITSFMMYYLFLYTRWSDEIIRFQNTKLEEQKNNLLTSQIQPHFIYNTLNIIYSLCHTNPKLAADTILNFSSYLRNNLDISANNELIPIEKEIEHTKLYSAIEQLRFNELKVIYDINDENYYVPFLIIQPMVENAIRHGVRGKENGKVTVELYQEIKPLALKYHVIKISDNGNGVSLVNTHLGTHKGIGISNVKERVELLVHGEFNIDMSPQGTVVCIKIPFN